MAEFVHVPVLYNEIINSLDIENNGNPCPVYADCTGGGGSMSAGILERLPKTGRLIVFDQDPDAIEVLKNRFDGDSRVTVVHSNFSRFAEVMAELDIEKLDGIIADLGVSSFQLDEASRGFSYKMDADSKLDMRMSKSGLSAADIVNTYSEQEIARILFVYGDEKLSRVIAREIVKRRAVKPIETTFELAGLIKDVTPAKMRRTMSHNPCKKSFQALRIATNNEIDILDDAIEDMFSLLKIGGRISIITFHSLEDKKIKHAFLKHNEQCICPREAPVCTCGITPSGKLFKRVKPTAEEVERNPRSRSAILRTIEKVHE